MVEFLVNKVLLHASRQQVIEEYLSPKVVQEQVLFEFTHPDLKGLQVTVTHCHCRVSYQVVDLIWVKCLK